MIHGAFRAYPFGMADYTRGSVPEILAPGGDILSVKAALEAGADAVYLGLPAFNARRKASNITAADLPHLVLLAHERGVKIFVTANILITQGEIGQYSEFISFCLASGVDGLIIADLGALSLLHSLFPGTELHASTQMTTHNTAQIDFLRSFGVKRVNLGRELPLQRVAEITRYAHGIGMETEVFVHGAYCISYSGQCYMSSFLGGESGNRGVCFQPCRRRYNLEGSGSADPVNFLSLKDNNALSLTEALVKAGVDAVKIEGRMKNFQYVHTVVTAWRRRLDTLARGEEDRENYGDLSRVFNRGFSAGYALDRVGPEMFAQSPFDQSFQVAGRVVSYRADTGTLTTDSPMPGTGTEISICTEDNLQICTAVVEQGDSGEPSARIRITNALKGKILPGQMVLSASVRLRSPGLAERLEALEPRKIPLRARLSGRAGEPLVLEMTARESLSPGTAAPPAVRVESSVPLAAAVKAPLTVDAAAAQLGRLGDTPFELISCDADGLEGSLFIPVKELNDLRRRAVARLGHDPGRFVVTAIPRTFPELPAEGLSARKVRSGLALLFSDPAEAEDFAGSGAEILLEVGDPAGFPAGAGFIPWFPGITRQEDLEGWKALLGRTSSLCVAGNTGIGFEAGKRGLPWLAGPPFNCTNSRTFKTVMDRGASGAFVSPELSREQIDDLSAPEDFSLWMKVAGPILLMTTRQCLFRNSCGKEYSGRACHTSCSRHRDFTGTGGGRFHIDKSPWQETRIFNDAILWIPEAVSRFRGQIDRFILDFRNLSFYSLSRETKGEIIDFFSALLKGSGEKNRRDYKPPFPITAGLYRRGLS
ncbi:MAG: U32 family peptidase [Spirochaetales bacterium]|nr:U32 family peptidase [Spirochaetales bacterium]